MTVLKSFIQQLRFAVKGVAKVTGCVLTFTSTGIHLTTPMYFFQLSMPNPDPVSPCGRSKSTFIDKKLLKGVGFYSKLNRPVGLYFM